MFIISDSNKSDDDVFGYWIMSDLKFVLLYFVLYQILQNSIKVTRSGLLKGILKDQKGLRRKPTFNI